MKIISSYKDINVDEIKIGDNFLAIKEDDSFESYQFEKKDDIIYKFKVNIPNNYIERFDGNKEHYYLNNFFYYENQLFLLDNSIMVCYDVFTKEKKFREESDLLYKIKSCILSSNPSAISITMTLLCSSITTFPFILLSIIYPIAFS